MKKRLLTAGIALVIGASGMVSPAAESSGKKVPMTFLDTLNRGREVSISAADFAQRKDSVVTQPGSQPLSSKPEEAIEPEPNQAPITLFRIQVLASSNQQMVKQKGDALAAKVGVPVSVEFEKPYYKLFAGEFTGRSDAEALLAQVKKSGYNDAWISRITRKPALLKMQR